MSDEGVVSILAGKFSTLSNIAFIVNFTLLQVCTAELFLWIYIDDVVVLRSVFLQLWSQCYHICEFRVVYLTPKTYSHLQIYPAEIFPTRYRAFAHGISAACGKAGAIISASAFSVLTNKVGTPAVLWSTSYAPAHISEAAFDDFCT